MDSLRRVAFLVTALLVAAWLVAFTLVRQPSLASYDPVPSRRANPDRLRTDVEFLATRVAPRDVQHVENLERAADYIDSAWRAVGLVPQSERFPIREGSARNLIVSLDGAAGPAIVVGAHYDAVGEFGPNPGADDNASGTAALLELARVLDRRRLAQPIELVAFGTEEPPYFASPAMGSEVHARSRARPAAMLCLEMIGYYTDTQDWPQLALALLYPRNGRFLAIVGRWSDRALARHVKAGFRGGSRLPVVSYSGPDAPGIDASDQRSYWSRGIPAVMLTDTAFVRNRNYHAPGDRPATLDYERMAEVVDGIANTLYRPFRRD